MPKLTAANIVSAIKNLPRNQDFNYIVDKGGRIRVEHITEPEGPITIKRWFPSKRQTPESVTTISISSNIIWRYANSFTDGMPVNVDRALAATGSVRSVLESLLAHSPEFYFCYPGRIEDTGKTVKIKPGQKHLIWCQNEPHENGVLSKKDVDNMAISELPKQEVIYDLVLPTGYKDPDIKNLNDLRRHTQMQVSLYLIGLNLGYRTWIAKNDKGIIYNGKPLIEYDNIVRDLKDEQVVGAHANVVKAGNYIDCIWFQNSMLMPAVIEVEHTTGVESGLTRMMKFKKEFPMYQTRYVIVAADKDRSKVMTLASHDLYKPLNAFYFSYSAVEELLSLCLRRNLSRKSVTDGFLDCFMERTVVT